MLNTGADKEHQAAEEDRSKQDIHQAGAYALKHTYCPCVVPQGVADNVADNVAAAAEVAARTIAAVAAGSAAGCTFREDCRRYPAAQKEYPAEGQPDSPS